MAQSALNDLADAVINLTQAMTAIADKQNKILHFLEHIDHGLREGDYDRIDPDEFRRLCMDASDIERRTRHLNDQ